MVDIRMRQGDTRRLTDGNALYSVRECDEIPVFGPDWVADWEDIVMANEYTIRLFVGAKDIRKRDVPFLTVILKARGMKRKLVRLSDLVTKRLTTGVYTIQIQPTDPMFIPGPAERFYVE